MTVADVVVKSLPVIEIGDSGWVIFAAWTSFFVGLGTLGLAVVTWKLAQATVRANGLESLREKRAARPIIIAFIEPHDELREAALEAFGYEMLLINRGATALYVSIFARSDDGLSLQQTNTTQVLGAGETIRTRVTVTHDLMYVQKVRIRYQDVFGNKYMTEYRSLSRGLTYPIFRLPWLDRKLEPRPPKWSGEVTWEVEHFERQADDPNEKLDQHAATVS